MNLLSFVYATLTVVVLPLGVVINYYTSILPNVLVRIFRYGRANISKSGTDLMHRLEVPKSWFAHFYLYALVFHGSVLFTIIRKYFHQNHSDSWLSIILFYIGDNNHPPSVSAATTLLVTALFFIHLARRLYETLFVSIFSGTKMNIFHYGIAFVHYTGASLSLITSSPGFSSEASLESTIDVDNKISSIILCTPIQCFADFLFLYGSYQQHLAHKGYADLRKGKDKTVSTFEHKIPRGGLFEKVSCPNYFAEVIIYCSFALMFGFQNYTWNFCTMWVIGNQVTSGIMNHKWYQEKFGDSYPKNRKAIIPYLL